MYNFNFNEKDYNFPNCWEDLSVEDFINILKLEKTKDLYQFDELYLAKIIEVLLNISEEEFNDFDLDIFSKLVQEISFLQETATYENKKDIYIDGVKYVTPMNFNKISLGEYASIKTLTKDKPYEEQLLIISSIIVRPEGEKFEATKINERKERFKKLRLVDINECISFFLSGNN
jgi:hypothetical protein